MIQSIVAFILAIVCLVISQLQIQGKLRWSGNRLGFWGEDSFLRKYKNINKEKGKFQVTVPKNNLYYNFFKIKYEEAFPLSATFLVAFTDGYHMFQSLFFLFTSFGISQLSHISFFIVWPSLLVVFSLTYRLLQR